LIYKIVCTFFVCCLLVFASGAYYIHYLNSEESLSNEDAKELLEKYFCTLPDAQIIKAEWFRSMGEEDILHIEFTLPDKLKPKEWLNDIIIKSFNKTIQFEHTYPFLDEYGYYIRKTEMSTGDYFIEFKREKNIFEAFMRLREKWKQP